MTSSRRDFIRNAALAGVGMTVSSAASVTRAAVPARGAGATYMGDLAAPALPVVRCALIGVGARGSHHAAQLAQMEGTEIVAVCDLYQDLAEESAAVYREAGKEARHRDVAAYFGGEHEWRKMLEEIRPDAVFISTPWESHAPMAIASMEQGAHAFVEVPLAVTLDQMWAIVETSERTRKHCMMMENVNYGREELMYLNMCRQGVIGDLLHAEAAYIHELRWQMDEVERGTGSWRTPHYAKRNGNLYPTHGLGPVAQYMNLARGEDNFDRMVSFSTPAIGRNAYADKNYPAGHKWNQLDFTGGDMNTSIVKTVLGRTILVQWDETSPRPYSRRNLVQGTKGVLAGFPGRAAFDGGLEGVTEDHHHWVEGEQMERLYEKYEHPLYTRLGALAEKMGGHGGMDFMMLYRIVECLREGTALDQNLYEGCFWSAVGPLSEASVAAEGAPRFFPDFTRNDWKTTRALGIVS
ncbi:MAG: Gfo/Idh/MocA family oxidoreductase [Xanthomonadales bacterium]|jgi:predicted dehydrogenase|nr:Gfo/Idh/MocA family oxidoreductase [Xanthomonadales bacterium]